VVAVSLASSHLTTPRAPLLEGSLFEASLLEESLPEASLPEASLFKNPRGSKNASYRPPPLIIERRLRPTGLGLAWLGTAGLDWAWVSLLASAVRRYGERPWADESKTNNKRTPMFALKRFSPQTD
jgi:hypothetical protein